MSELNIFVDYANLDSRLTAPGPVAMARVLLSLVPDLVLASYNEFHFRLYGGWRSDGRPTVGAQNILPAVLQESPAVVSLGCGSESRSCRLIVDLAYGPIGSKLILNETLAKSRSLRSFRSQLSASNKCATPHACGLSPFEKINHSSRCPGNQCDVRVGDILVRDEQKMVDTLLVADVAESVLGQKACDLVLVSSDTDMWPAVLLAIRAGCKVIHIHPKAGAATQPHLLATVPVPSASLYIQVPT